jgi:uncharacterized protein YeeX (DUF496 family)
MKINPNYAPHEVIQKIQRLFTEPTDNHVRKIIAFMVLYEIYLPKILVETLKQEMKNDHWAEIVKNICETTGYSFDDFIIKDTTKEKLKRLFPNMCKGCAERKKIWTSRFEKIKKEIEDAKMNFALAGS